MMPGDEGSRRGAPDEGGRDSPRKYPSLVAGGSRRCLRALLVPLRDARGWVEVEGSFGLSRARSRRSKGATATDGDEEEEERLGDKIPTREEKKRTVSGGRR